MINLFITGESGTIPITIQKILCDSKKFNVVNSQLIVNDLFQLKTHNSFKVRKNEVDFLDFDVLRKVFSHAKIDLVIHSGAFVGTDFCSNNSNLSIKTNIEGTNNIVELCNRYDTPILYLSTTAIFDPKDYNKDKPITEKTKINPQTLYGITKYSAELIVKNLCKTKKIIIRPVFCFGDYPDDLHSALTKVIYILYNNITKNEHEKLDVLLDKNINKSYTRVENVSNIILEVIEKFYDENFECLEFNVGENFKNSKNWNSLLEIISRVFCNEMNIEQKEVYKIFNESIIFNKDLDYLHYHNIDDEKLVSNKLYYFRKDRYINIEEGIKKTLRSVIENSHIKPYWI